MTRFWIGVIKRTCTKRGRRWICQIPAMEKAPLNWMKKRGSLSLLQSNTRHWSRKPELYCKAGKIPDDTAYQVQRCSKILPLARCQHYQPVIDCPIEQVPVELMRQYASQLRYGHWSFEGLFLYVFDQMKVDSPQITEQLYGFIGLPQKT